VNPEQEVTLHVPAEGKIGLPVKATVQASSRTIGGCDEKHDDMFGHYDCSSREDLGAKITSVTCEPADACGSIALAGADASWISLVAQYDVTVVVDGDGVHRTETKHFAASPPHVELTRQESSRGFLAGYERKLCLTGDDLSASAGISFDVELDGEPIAITPMGTCFRVKPAKHGVLHATARLITPARDLTYIDVPVFDLTQPFALSMTDAACGYDKAKDVWMLRPTIIASFNEIDTFAVPAEKLVYRDGDREVASTDGWRVELHEPPSPTATLEAKIGSQKASLAVDANCP
jgi:hypothetical protein